MVEEWEFQTPFADAKTGPRLGQDHLNVVQLGFDPVWFGVLIVLVVQIGLISPPVGMNLFVLSSLLTGVAMGQIFRGVWMFVVALFVALVMVLEFQPLALFLPSFMT